MDLPVATFAQRLQVGFLKDQIWPVLDSLFVVNFLARARDSLLKADLAERILGPETLAQGFPG